MIFLTREIYFCKEKLVKWANLFLCTLLLIYRRMLVFR